jgi:Nuclease-related domain
MRMLLAGTTALATLAVAWLLLGLGSWALVAVEAVLVVGVVAADRLVGPRFDRWLQGAGGEESVGALLDGLVGEGWLAIHDVSLGRGNVDHIVVGPGGVFAVETKSHRGRISVDRLDPRWLKQAHAERKLIERITGMEVQALLVFSEAWLVGSVPARREGVTVLPARMLAWYLSRRRPVMSVEEARAVHGRLVGAVGALDS